MSLSNSSEIVDQTIMTFSGIMDEAMSIIQESGELFLGSTATTSSTRQPKHRRRYVNRDHEAAHFRL
jgi:hypothetical protein